MVGQLLNLVSVCSIDINLLRMKSIISLIGFDSYLPFVKHKKHGVNFDKFTKMIYMKKISYIKFIYRTKSRS